ncbi:MAG: cytochrome c peroxidase [Bacteroidota bacterium]
MNRSTTYFLVAIFSCLILSGCAEDKLSNPLDVSLKRRLNAISPTNSFSHYIMPSETAYEEIPQDPSNPLNRQKVALGRMLFYETGLARDANQISSNNTYSCASCHIPSAAFTPGREQGIADGAFGFGYNGEGRQLLQSYDPNEVDAQGARPLSMLNVAYVTNTMWSGRFGSIDNNIGTEHLWEGGLEVNHLGLHGLEAQNIEGLHLHRMIINESLMTELGYKDYFDIAFQEFPKEERYTDITASFAISAYLRTLLTNQSPFQEWLKGNEDAMTDQEKGGALLFFTKAGCYKCHEGPALNANEYYAIGVKDLHEIEGVVRTSRDDNRNLGRGGFTGKPADMYKFKVPQLYNLREAPFLFHGSSMTTLQEAVEYFNDAIPENADVPTSQIASQMKPLALSEEEMDALTAFLSNALYDSNIERYVPNNVLSGNCIPNNDSVSKKDLNCE